MKCSVRRRDGKPCQAAAIKDGRCLFHARDAKLTRALKQGRVSGGLVMQRFSKCPTLSESTPAVRLTSPQDILELLSAPISQVRTGLLDRGIAQVIAGLASVAQRCLQPEPYHEANVAFIVHAPSGRIPCACVETGTADATCIQCSGSGYLPESNERLSAGADAN